MRIDLAIPKLQEMLSVDPDAEIEIHTPEDRYYDIILYSEEQDSEYDKIDARKKKHPILRAVFEAEI